MDVYLTEEGRSYVVVDLKETKEKALTKANSHFKIKKERLQIGYGWIKDEGLYFKETRGAKKCWLVWRKTRDEY